MIQSRQLAAWVWREMTETEYKNLGKILYGGFPAGSVVKTPTANAGNVCSIPGWGICPEEANGKPFQYSSENFHGQRSPAGYSTQGRKRVGHNLVTEQQNNILYLDSVMLVTEVTTSVKTQTVNLDGVMFYYIKRTISTKLT